MQYRKPNPRRHDQTRINPQPLPPAGLNWINPQPLPPHGGVPRRIPRGRWSMLSGGGEACNDTESDRDRHRWGADAYHVRW